MQKKLDETDTDFQQRKLAKQVEAAEASKKVTEDEQAAKEKITDTHTQARIGAEQSMQNAMQPMKRQPAISIQPHPGQPPRSEKNNAIVTRKQIGRASCRERV